MNISIAFLLTLIAGLSTMLGVIPIFINIKNINKLITSSLAFASGVMLCISITDLIPESINMLRTNLPEILILLVIIISIIIGILTSYIIEKNLSLNNNSLYKVGIISMLAIIIHNIPEGIATFISTTKDTSLGISLTIAIAIHNLPEGLSIAIPIYYSTTKKSKALIYTLIAALSEPLGAILTYLFLLNLINNTILGLLFSFIAGIMLSISLTELLPSSISYKEPKITKLFFILGIIFMLLKFLI